MSTWVAVLACAAVAYLLRASMVLVLAGRRLHPSVARHLGAVGPSVLGSIVAYGVVVRHGVAALPDPVVLFAVLAALAVVARTGRPLHALLVGLPSAWILTVVVP